MQPLDAQSTLQVYGEASGWPMHNGTLQIYDAAAATVTFDIDWIRRVYAERLAGLPAFRQRLVHAPGRLSPPVWVEAGTIDVDAHFQALTLEPPGDDEQLGRLAGCLMENPMDHTRPLWDGYVIEGLSDGRVALLFRTHHAVVDGIRGMELQRALFDPSPEGRDMATVTTDSASPEAEPSWWQLAGYSARYVAGTPVRLTRTAFRLAGLAGQAARETAKNGLSRPRLPAAAPRTRINGAITSRREVAFCSIPLPGVKAFAKRHGATVNDAVLLLVSGALRTYLADHGGLPQQSLLATVPVGVRSDDADSAMGNRWQVINTTLATDQEDRLERLATIVASMDAEKEKMLNTDPSAWSDAVDVPPLVVSLGAQWYAKLGLSRLHPPASNVTVSNVRGAPMPMYLGGVRQLASYPLGPLADGMGLNITVIGYAGNLDFGLHACPDLVPDLWQIAAALREEAAAISELT